MDTNYIIIGLLVLFLVVFVACQCMKKQKIASREPYQDMFYASDYSKNNWVSRPTFRADLSPRFDNTPARAGAISGTPPPFAMQGAPVTPVQSLVEGYAPDESYSNLGGAYADPRLPSGGLSTSQVNNILAQKFGRNGPGEYVEPAALLPVPDMRKGAARDPSDPSTFTYDRYIFAQLKRRYPNVGVDFIRGDVQIAPIKTGWFDTYSPVKTDLAQGYFADYVDIQQSTAIKDAVFERAPTPEENNPWGKLAERTVYSLL